MRKNIFLAVLLLGCSILMILAGFVFDRRSRPVEAPPVSDATPYIEISMSEEVSLVGGVIEEWAKWETSAVDLYNLYRKVTPMYCARPVVIQWGVFDIPQGSFIRKQYLELSTDQSFQDPVRYDLRSGERRVDLQNLLVDTDYYFRITLELENYQGCVSEGHFKTKWSPRILELENLRNVRDIGGWKTADGKSVRQGLLYRGGELDGATVKKYQITDAGKETMTEELKIKTQLDLRASTQEGVRNALGKDVEHRYFALPSYAGCFTDESNRALAAVFDALAEKERYPIYLNCSNGAHQTGIVCFLLEALLGVPEKDCYREWELSVFATGENKYEQMNRFTQTLRDMEGDTLQEKTEGYLLSIGVTAEQIASIRSILVG